MADPVASEGFEREEHPTQPASPPRTKTSRWRAVTSAALERGFGRLSDGEYDEGPEAATSAPVTVAADDGGSTEAQEPDGGPGVDVEFAPSIVPPAPPPMGEPPVAEPSRAPGPRGTVRMAAVSRREDRGPTGTVRMASRAEAVASFVAWQPPPRTSAVLVVFTLLAIAQFVYIVASGAPTQSTVTALPLVDPVASESSWPTPPLPTEPAAATEDPPFAAPTASTAQVKPAASTAGVRPRKAHATHTGSNVL
jgi:hypothetical protein